MAKYYYCNGTTKLDLPCQIPVPKERDRCHFHNDDGGGPGPKAVASSIYKMAKATLDAICYIHSASDAVPFAIELAKKGLDLLNIIVNADYDEPSDLFEEYANNESIIISNLESRREEELIQLVGLCNHILSYASAEKGNEAVVLMAH